MTIVAEPEEAVLVAHDVADLVTLTQQRPEDSGLEEVVARMLERHRSTAVKLSAAARFLEVSTTTVATWVTRGLLDEMATGRVRRVSSVSLGKTLAFTRLIGKDGPNRRERILRILEQMRDRDLLKRAQDAAASSNDNHVVRYDDAALEELRNL